MNERLQLKRPNLDAYITKLFFNILIFVNQRSPKISVKLC